MKQVCLHNGVVTVADVPAPLCQPGGVLVWTWHSVISSGTELATTATAGSPLRLMARAASDPRILRKVWDKVQAVGVRQTTELVRARQHLSLPLGYSAAGQVVEVGSGVTHLSVGDMVACAGAGYANHAEVNFVPRHLAARVPPGVSTVEAAYATLGAIAMQGVRRLGPALGDMVVVVGLGLLGQLTVQLLRLNGCRVFGLDPRPARAALARSWGADDTSTSDSAEMRAAIDHWSSGHLADGVIVCAGAKDGQLLNRSFDLVRRKGRLVLVGDVPIRISREAIYRKELDFLVSTSYGPGRYDRGYEEHGLDYPRAYVRWTEGRNLEEVLRLIASGQLKVSALTEMTVPIAEAAGAYARLAEAEPPVATVIAYPHDAPPAPRSRPAFATRAPSAPSSTVVLGVIGAGSFFRGVHLPNLQRQQGVSLKYLVGRSGLAVHDLARAAGVPHPTTSADDVLDDPDVDAVLVTTRHDLHADLACRALEAGKHVFVEKPLGLTTAECQRVVDVAARTGRLVAVGFNRRFAPLARQMHQAASRIRGPRTVLIRVNAGPLAEDHWLLDPREGGGRLRGEGVHFFDLARWLIGSSVSGVRAAALTQGAAGADANNVVTTLEFADGSLATVHYVSQGSPALAKERIELFGGGEAFVLDDFRALTIAGASVKTVDRRVIQKGHSELLGHFLDAVRGRATLEVTADDGLQATWAAEQALGALAGPGGG